MEVPINLSKDDLPIRPITIITHITHVTSTRLSLFLIFTINDFLMVDISGNTAFTTLLSNLLLRLQLTMRNSNYYIIHSNNHLRCGWIRVQWKEYCVYLPWVFLRHNDCLKEYKASGESSSVKDFLSCRQLNIQTWLSQNWGIRILFWTSNDRK